MQYLRTTRTLCIESLKTSLTLFLKITLSRLRKTRQSLSRGRAHKSRYIMKPDMQTFAKISLAVTANKISIEHDQINQSINQPINQARVMLRIDGQSQSPKTHSLPWSTSIPLWCARFHFKVSRGLKCFHARRLKVSREFPLDVKYCSELNTQLSFFLSV